MSDAAWMLAFYLAGTFATLLARNLNHEEAKQRYIQIFKENVELKKALAELAGSVENRAREIAVNALKEVTTGLQGNK